MDKENLLKSVKELTESGNGSLERKLDQKEGQESGLSTEELEAIDNYARSPEQRQEAIKITLEKKKLEEEAKKLGITIEELEAIDNYARSPEQRQEAIKAAQKNMGVQEQSQEKGPEAEKNLENKEKIEPEEIEAMEDYAKKTAEKDRAELAQVREEMGLAQPKEESPESETPEQKNKEEEETDPEKEALKKQRKLFEKDLSENNLSSAKTRLLELEPKIEAREMDHKSRELAKAAKKTGNWQIAIDMIPYARTEADRKARANAFPEEIKKQYANDLRPYLEQSEDQGEKENKPESEIESMDKTKTSYFKALIEAGRFDEAQAWMLENKDKKYAGNIDWLKQVSHPLFKHHRENKDWKAAKEMVEILPDDQDKENRKKKLSEEAAIPYEQI